MTRTTIIAVAAGVTIGYLLHAPSPESLLASLVVAAVGFMAIRHLRTTGATTVDAPRPDALAEEMARARRFGHQLSLVAVRALDAAVDEARILKLASTRFVDRSMTDEATIPRSSSPWPGWARASGRSTGAPSTTPSAC